MRCFEEISGNEETGNPGVVRNIHIRECRPQSIYDTSHVVVDTVKSVGENTERNTLLVYMLLEQAVLSLTKIIYPGSPAKAQARILSVCSSVAKIQ